MRNLALVIPDPSPGFDDQKFKTFTVDKINFFLDKCSIF
jgi:hypothetical protein